jgi:hypothetical protein
MHGRAAKADVTLGECRITAGLSSVPALLVIVKKATRAAPA